MGNIQNIGSSNAASQGSNMVASYPALLALVLMACGGAAAVPVAADDADQDGLIDALDPDPFDPDVDGDGLLDGEDPAPTSLDGDGDGLTDVEEVALGTDALSADTDRDGYDDPLELAVGTDPVDPESLPYIGGWPVNLDKDTLEEPPDGELLTVGERMPRFTLQDQYGDLVDVYDFAGHDAPVLLVRCAIWVTGCADVGNWLAGEPSPIDDLPWDWVTHIPAAAQAGQLHVLITLDQNLSRGPVTADQALAWIETWPALLVPALADPSNSVRDWMEAETWPVFVAADDSLVVAGVGVYNEVMPVIDGLLPG